MFGGCAPPRADCGETVAGFEDQLPLWQALGGPRKSGDAERKRKIIALGYAGAVPLFHGDILVMEGTMQTHFEHETLVMSRIKSLEDLLAEYPATIQKSQDLLRDALSSTLETKFDKRLNLTTRFISNHKPICANHISAATTGHQPNALTGCIMPRPPAPRPPDKWLLLETKVALRSYRPCQCPPPRTHHSDGYKIENQSARPRARPSTSASACVSTCMGCMNIDPTSSWIRTYKYVGVRTYVRTCVRICTYVRTYVRT